jgi:signal transduction histidine kinase
VTEVGEQGRGLSGRLRRLTVGQILGLTIGVLLVLAAAGIGGALLANNSLTHNRNLLLEQVGPSLRAELNLEAALIDEETGVRGYLIGADPNFLAPYKEGTKREATAFAALEARQAEVGPPVSGEIAAVRASVATWRTRYAEQALGKSPQAGARSQAEALRGKALFDAVRRSLATLQGSLTRKDNKARAQLNDAAATLEALLILAAALVLGSVLGAGLILRATVTRPLAALERSAAGGELAAPLPAIEGPREIRSLSIEIEQMRRRIVRELELVEAGRMRLEEQARELTRSNAELEQFAYVASHDLQEPLRKIASFCQALQSRYQGQLDERADQYLDFAVDGAKRMQSLINDLLAFSRVGRGGRAHEPVVLGEAVEGAVSALAETLEAAGARVEAGELPVLLGDATLLRSLFQNLIGNAVKFRATEPPVVEIAARQDGGEWLFSVSDNGIGIEPEYAERIFLIFQRLHTREAFDGSGIGLALCRKIVEYHEGRIWLDTSYTGGARFNFTLPATKESIR